MSTIDLSQQISDHSNVKSSGTVKCSGRFQGLKLTLPAQQFLVKSDHKLKDYAIDMQAIYERDFIPLSAHQSEIQMTQCRTKMLQAVKMNLIGPIILPRHLPPLPPPALPRESGRSN